MRNFIGIVIFCWLIGLARASDEIVMHSEVVQQLYIDSAPLKRTDEYIIILRIENVGAGDVTLPTQGYSDYIQMKGNELYIHISFPPDKIKYGKRVVKAKSDFGPATAHHDEIIEITIEFRKPEDIPNDFVVNFDFSIRKDVAERYGLWSGNVKGRALYNEIPGKQSAATEPAKAME